MKKIIIGATSIAISLGFATGIVFAGNAGDGSGYGTQPGYAVANENTICAGHGAFGAFGKDYNLAGGADGTQTGLNNSRLCGNRQGNLE
jgi:hypothetical protein